MNPVGVILGVVVTWYLFKLIRSLWRWLRHGPDDIEKYWRSW